jgi:hypothetical protein
MEIGITIIAICVVVMAGLFARLVRNEKIDSMTDKEKLEKLVAEIKRLYHQSLVDENRQAELGLSSAACTSYGKSKVCKELLSFTDSMQKEPKKCMYSKDNYTDEDREVLCDGCTEECRYNKLNTMLDNTLSKETKESWNKRLGEEPVSEDLEEELSAYVNSEEYLNNIGTSGLLLIARHFADWQKQQMMKEAVSGHVGQTINGMLRALSDETFGDMGFTAGDKVKLIIIKEE